MALHYFEINKGDDVSTVTSGTSASFAYSKAVQVTWDSTIITDAITLLTHIQRIMDFLTKDDITAQTNAKPIGYRIAYGGGNADVNFRNHASGDTNSILDTGEHVAIEGSYFDDNNQVDTVFIDAVENIKTAIVQSSFPIG
jgi:hypothetical protein